MQAKKVVTGDYTDPETGLRFVEDVRGNLHCVMSMTSSEPVDMNIVEEIHKRNKRLERILESLRKENNWLWERISVTIRDKKTPQRSIERLEKAIKERKR